jgi:hypothetical protein
MNEPTITCPSCHTEIKLTESLAAPLIESTRRDFERKIALKESEIGKREEAIQEQQAALAKAQETVEEQVQAKLKGEREKIAVEEARKAKLLLATDLDQKGKELVELQQVLADRNTKLAAAQVAQAELIRKQRELDDAKREMELTIETRVQGSLSTVRDKARQEAEEGLKLKLAEKEETMASMQRQIEELKRKSEQGSQQLQGEAQELELEKALENGFPMDTFEPVPKGQFGGDILHRVIGPGGQICGTILWESKRTKNWSDGWLSKLRGDQRAAKAEIAVIVSQAMPKQVEAFDLVGGIWVTKPHFVVPIALTLRQSLIELAAARIAGVGQQTKMELVYRYLTGPQFRQRIEAIVEHFTTMHKDLEKERTTMTRLWAKREQQIRGVIESTAGLYGDLQGIAGRTLLEIKGLEINLLPEGPTPPEST